MATFDAESVTTPSGYQANDGSLLLPVLGGDLSGNSYSVAVSYEGRHISEYDVFVRRYTG